MFGYIYMTTNQVNGKKYVGKRYGEFTSSYLGSGVVLKQAINKYGKDAFMVVLIKECVDENDINQSEVDLINIIGPEYNIADGGTGGDTLKHATDDYKKSVIKKRSESLSDAWSKADKAAWGAAISKAKKGKRYGGVKYHTEESKRKISESNRTSAKNRPSSWKKNHAIASAKRKGVPNYHSMKPLVLDGIRYESRKSASEILDVSPATINNYIKRGRGYYI